MSTRNPPPDSFSAAERRIAITERKLPGISAERIAAVRLIGHIHKRGQTISNAALKPHGLNMATYGALMMLIGSEDNRLTVSELAEASGQKRANMTRICDELLSKGLIERTAGTLDRRAIFVALTAKGQTLLTGLVPAVNGMVSFVEDGCPASELPQLMRLLRRLLGRLDRYSPDDLGEDDLP